MRQNERRRAINRSSRAKLRTSIKNLRSALKGSDATKVGALLPKTVSEIDRAVQKGVLHRNAAARHKSRLTVRATQAAAK
jgi:small subunit ribosomal protein S20